MKDTERFHNYDDEVKELVLNFERMVQEGEHKFFDLDEMEIIIDYYMETMDYENMARAVFYGQELYPNAISMEIREAYQLCGIGQYDKALSLLKRLEKKDSKNADISYAIGMIYEEQHEYEKSIEYLLKSAEEGHLVGDIYIDVAEEYSRIERYADAEEYYLRGIHHLHKEKSENEQFETDENRALIGLMQVYDWADKMDKSVNYFRKYVKEYPYCDVAWCCLGYTYLNLSLYERAVESFLYCLAINKKYTQASLHLAQTYSLMGEPKKGIEVLHDAINNSELAEQALLYQTIARMYMEPTQNNAEAAIANLRKGLKKFPENGALWMELSNVYATQGALDDAIDAIERALRTDRESIEYLHTSAWLHYHKGDYAKSEERFLQAIKVDIDAQHHSDYVWIHYADFMIATGNYKEALNILDRGMEESVECLDFYMRIAYCNFRLNNRYLMFNAIEDCLYASAGGGEELTKMFPEMFYDAEVRELIKSHQQE